MADEFLASNEFPGDGVTTLYNVSFKGNRPDAGSGVVPYLDPADVKAQVVTPATTSSGPIVVDVPIVYVGPNQFSVSPPTPIGKITRIYRATQDEYSLVNYQSLQTVGEADLDLSNRQAVFIVQEAHDLATRAAIAAGQVNQVAYDAAQAAQDAADTAADAAENAAAAAASAAAIAAETSVALTRTVRVTDGTLIELPVAAVRGGKILGFDDVTGQPSLFTAASGSASALALDLANASNPAKGAALVGYNSTTVAASLAQGVNDLNTYKANLANTSDPTKGAKLIGYNGSTVDVALASGVTALTTYKADLLNNTDLTKGAALIGRATRVVASIAELRTINGLFNGDAVYVRSYYDLVPYDGGGMFTWDSGNVITDDNGVNIKGPATTGRWVRQFDDLFVGHFGANSVIADCTTNLGYARAYIQAQLLPQALHFKKGRYTYSVSPNWAINDAQIVFKGEVRLRYTGTGNAVLLDGQNNGGNIYRLKFGVGNAPIIEAPSTALDGIYVTSCHHSKIAGCVVGAGSASAGLRIKFAVCSTFDIQVSNNPDGSWYSTTPPNYGVFATELNPGELCSYCQFNSPILEHLPVGMHLDKAFGNHILGGTMEGCGIGLFLTINAFTNKIYFTDFEVNTDHDIYCLGRENFFVNTDTNKQITLDGTAVNNRVIGGSHSKILVTASAVNNIVQDLIYNRNNDSSTITDSTGGKLLQQRCTNRGLGRVEVNGILSTFAITVPAGPNTLTFTNTALKSVRVFVVGGDVSLITLTRNGSPAGTGEVAGSFQLDSLDALNITYGLTSPAVYGLT